jgi:hypothetical protein
MILEQGAVDVITSKSRRKLPEGFDAELCRDRNKIERFRSAQSLIPPHRNAIREDVTELHGDDQTGSCGSIFTDPLPNNEVTQFPRFLVLMVSTRNVK